MINITKKEAFWLREKGYGNKVKMSGTKRKFYCVCDYRYKYDSDGETVLSAKPVGALKALYDYRKMLKKE